LPKDKASIQKIAGLCGIIGPLVSFCFIALAISHSLSWFSWTSSALSDLAGPKATITATTIFNFGLILGGLLSMIFAIGLIHVLRKRTLGLIGALLLVLSDASLIAVGIFPETTGRIHFYVSVAFFALFPISLFFIGASAVMDSSERDLGFATILFGMFAVISVAPLILVDVTDVGIHELLAALAGSMWSIILGIKLYRQSILHS
jgi:hypothetical membrane protein